MRSSSTTPVVIIDIGVGASFCVRYPVLRKQIPKSSKLTLFLRKENCSICPDLRKHYLFLCKLTPVLRKKTLKPPINKGFQTLK